MSSIYLGAIIINKIWQSRDEVSANIRDVVKVALLVHNVHDIRMIRTMKHCKIVCFISYTFAF
jgi:hypothetical protein